MSNRSRRPPKTRPPSPDAVDALWRLFIALPLPEDAKAQITRLIDNLTPEAWPVRWISPHTAHLTLHFLGNTHPDRAELLRLALAEPIGRQTAFELRTNHLGVFPNLQRPRVLWLGLDGQLQQLQSLHHATGETLRQLDFPVEAGKFHPHITLGRARENPSPTFSDAVVRRFDELSRSQILTPTRIPVHEVLLIRSFLSKGGARHEPIARYPLR